MKGKNFWVGVCVGIIIMIGAGLCFYAGTKVASKEDKKDSKTEEKAEKKDEVKIEELSLDDSIVEEASLLIPRNLCHGMAIKFANKDRTVKDLSDQEKLAIAASYLSNGLNFDNISDDDYTGEVHKEISEEDIKKVFEDTSFLDTLKKSKDKTYSLGASSIYYNKDKLYVNIIATGCIAEEYEDENAYLIEASKEGNKLYLTYAYAYLDVKFNTKLDNFESKWFKNKGDKEPIFVDSGDNEEFKDWDKLNQYKFVIDTSEGNMRLQEIQYKEA